VIALAVVNLLVGSSDHSMNGGRGGDATIDIGY
jgi:hypothetical protein